MSDREITHLKATVEFYCGCGQSAFYVEGQLDTSKGMTCKGCGCRWLVKFGSITPLGMVPERPE